VASRKTGPRAARRLVWTDRALRDLRDIDAYIAADDPIAERWVDKLIDAAQRAHEGAKSQPFGQEAREKRAWEYA